ncbi:MAG TPA: 3-deoxy-7-phosphoheptulonate synthase class II [Thermoanaerobaculia bacterium]|nr:3-deoxy-7-phosphoheptulonate synthase class II [Thermoanaerobaculia bacterium]
MSQSFSPRRPAPPPEPAPWSPDSWRARPALQQPEYPDPAALERAVCELSRLPPLVTSWEVESLKGQLAEAARGERFLLQGGDCAETFADCRPDPITSKLKILLQMSLVLVHGTRMRVTRVGRFAGQYAKPRSQPTEKVAGRTMPVYRGDLVNRVEADPAARVADPERLLRGYERSALTLNFIRGLIDGGFADLHHPEYWELDFGHDTPLGADYRRMVDSILESVSFMENLAGRAIGQLNRVDFFTSHEALHLPYEQALTRRVPRRAGWYDLSTHFPWIGVRTSEPEGAHVEFFRGVRNPVGVKIGPETDSDRLLRLLDLLHPENEPGRLTLIHRLGAGRVAEHLPRLIETVRRSGRSVLWSCDPMHGNTQSTTRGVKTRRFDKIVAELEESFRIHREMGSWLGGIHIEVTGEDVTECTGGARGLDEDGLARAYRSFVDPRLNYEQALELAMRLAKAIGPGGRSPLAPLAS